MGGGGGGGEVGESHNECRKENKGFERLHFCLGDSLARLPKTGNHQQLWNLICIMS